MIELAWPFALLLLPLPIFSWLFLSEQKQHRPEAIKTPLFSQWQKLSQTDNSSKSRRLLLIISALAWIALVVATARPQFIGEPLELPTTGRDLLLSIDISGSMEATDLQLNGREANRFDVVRHVMTEFIERREGDRIGLILFGERAYLQTPLTFDRKTVNYMLAETEIGLAGASRTAIGDGIGLAVKRLKERPAENRVLILLTDGQNNAGELDPIAAAKLAQHAGVKIYTIGVGADEMMIRDLFYGQRKVNPSEELDEETLMKVAELTGGQYFRARSKDELEKIYTELDKLEPVEDKPEIYRPVTELYFWPALLALLLHFLVLVLQYTKMRTWLSTSEGNTL